MRAQVLPHDIIGTWGVLDDSSLLQAAFDVPSLRRPCVRGAETSRGAVSERSHSELAGCTPKTHFVDGRRQSCVLDDSPLLQAAVDVSSLRRPCARGTEASRGIVSAKSHSKLAGCTPRTHIVDVCSQSCPCDFVQETLTTRESHSMFISTVPQSIFIAFESFC